MGVICLQWLLTTSDFRRLSIRPVSPWPWGWIFLSETTEKIWEKLWNERLGKNWEKLRILGFFGKKSKIQSKIQILAKETFLTVLPGGWNDLSGFPSFSAFWKNPFKSTGRTVVRPMGKRVRGHPSGKSNRFHPLTAQRGSWRRPGFHTDLQNQKTSRILQCVWADGCYKNQSSHGRLSNTKKILPVQGDERRHDHHMIINFFTLQVIKYSKSQALKVVFGCSSGLQVFSFANRKVAALR